MNNPPGQAAANPGQAAVALQDGQDEAARAEGAAIPRPVLFIDPRARLMDRPRNLYDLWTEYMFGHGANKPAKDFTVAERNSRESGLKQKFYHRSRVWRLQVYMLNAGMTMENANQLIVSTYGGHGVVSKIIKAIIGDANNPNNQLIPTVGFKVHPNLVVG